MPKLPELSAVVLSIDGDLRAPAALNLAARLRELDLTATWATSDIRDAEVPKGHELALRVDDEWLTSPKSRSQLVAKLSQSRDHVPTTLVIDEGTQVDPAADVLVRAGFSAVSSVTPPTRRALAWLRPTPMRIAMPQSIRWGLWQLATTASLSKLSTRGLRRQIDAAVQQGGLVHLTVELDDLVQGRWKPIARGLATIAEERDRERIANLTVAGVMQRLADCHQSRPTRSILARAA